MTKNVIIAFIAVCLTVLCLTLLTRDRLCDVNVSSGNTVVQVSLSYEKR